jgi:phasin family protein
MEWGRQQMAVASEGASTMMRGFEALRRLQDEATRQAAARHAEAARKLGTSPAPADLIATQSQLLRDDIEDATRYWQQVAATAFEMNSELLGCATQLVDTDDAFAAARLLHVKT